MYAGDYNGTLADVYELKGTLSDKVSVCIGILWPRFPYYGKKKVPNVWFEFQTINLDLLWYIAMNFGQLVYVI